MVKKIMIDAGHYGKYNRSPCNNNYYESQVMWKLQDFLRFHLERYGFIVGQTRDDQSKDKEVVDRGKCAKGYDLLISLHSNAVGNTPNDNVDYVVAIVPLNGSCDELGQNLADVVTDVMQTKQIGRIYKRESTRGDYYGVIRGGVSVGVPSIIIEHSFHTCPRSVAWLLDDLNLERLAKAEADAIAKYFGVSAPEKKTIHRVQLGSFTVKSNADALLKKVKAAGFTDAFITNTEV